MNLLNRFSIVQFTACLLLSALSNATAATPSFPSGLTRSNKPNIIFILADDLGYGELGSYGQKKIRTPNLDRFAAEGMRFKNFYAGSTVCAPSRASLMTGLHTGHLAIRGNNNPILDGPDVTVAELLRRAGYRTAHIGKWGLGNTNSAGNPNRRGFDEWFGFLDHLHAHQYYPDYLWRNQDVVEFEPNREGKKGSYSQNMFTVAALNFIRINQSRPFFLYLAYTIPHANNELGRRTGNGMEVPLQHQPYQNETWPEPEKNKAAMITLMDAYIGKIMDKLKELKIDEQTIVFFSSDNGPHKEGGVAPAFFASSGGLRGIKRDLYEGGIRIPFLARWPGKIKAGIASDHIGAFWDFLPAAAELAGVSSPGQIDGISFLPTLLGREAQQKTHSHLYWEFHEGGSSQAVRQGEWKALRHRPTGPIEIYNLRLDPGETNNLASTSTNLVSEAAALFTTARSESSRWSLREPDKTKSKTSAPAAEKPSTN